MAALNPRPRIPEWTLGERMAKSRESAGYSQAEMGAFFGVEGDTVSTWERETRQPKQFFEKLRRWAELCNVDHAWLVTGNATGSDSVVTKADTAYGGFTVIDEGQQRLPLALPPSRSEPELTLV